MVAILDADKEGFLRSKTSLIQTIGRAARNSEGRVILYANKMTNSLTYAIDETKRRREKQEAWNTENGMTPTTTISKLIDIDLDGKNYSIETPSNTKAHQEFNKEFRFYSSEDLAKEKSKLEKEMRKMADNLEFEKAIDIRAKIKKIDDLILDIIS